MEINKKEKEFALRAIEFYWDNWNKYHEDNLDDSNISDSLVKKLDLCIVVGRSEQLKPLDKDFNDALTDITESKIGNEPTKKRF